MKLKSHQEDGYSLASNKEFAIWGITLEQNEPSQQATFSIKYIMDALKCLENRGFDNVTLRVQNDFPIVLTTSPEHLNGLVISPLVKA